MKSLVPLIALPAALITLAANAPAPKPADVTQKVIAAVKANKLSLLVNAENLARVDADPPKLRITYQFTNRLRTRAWAEGQTVDLSVPAPQPLSITRAEYGQFDDNPVDVTPLIAALVKDNAIPPSAIDDQTMAVDPNHGVTKQLVLRYAIDGKQKMLNVEQNEELKIPAPPGGKKLTIIEATYGLPTTSFDVTDIVADLAQGNALAITPTDDLFGDPAPNLAGKKLEVEYMQAGETHTLSAERGAPLAIIPKNSTPLLILKATYGVILN